MNKTLKVMTSAALLAGVVAPVAVTTVDAAGQGTVKVLESYTVDKNSNERQDISRIQLTMTKNQVLTSGDNVIIELPNKVNLRGSSAGKEAVSASTIASGISILINDIKLTTTNFNVEVLKASNGNYNQIKLTYIGGTINPTGGFSEETGSTDNEKIYLLKDLAIVIPVSGTVQGITGDITANVLASNNSPFPNIKGAAISQASKGELQISAKNTRSSNNKFSFDLRLNESVAGTLADKGTVKLKLPSGFTWEKPADDAYTPLLGGNGQDVDVKFSLGSSDRELTISIDAYSTASAKAALLEIGSLKFQVDDERVAKKGDVKATVSGSHDTDISSLIVGKYGDYETATEVAEINEVLSGKKEQELGKIILKEELPNTWIPGRTVTITLPEYARWDEDESKASAEFDYTDGSAEFDAPAFLGSDNRTLKLTISGENENGASLRSSDEDPTVVEITGLSIYVKPGYEGDIKADIAGSAGVNIKDVTIAKAVKPFQMEASNVGDVIIGSQGQTSANLVIKETVAGAFGDGNDSDYARVTLPQGVKVSAKPEVKVTKGDLEISDVTFDNPVYGESYIQFRVLADSTEASEISINGLDLTLDRTVPVGNVTAKLKGDAVNEWAKDNDGKVAYDLRGWEDASAAQTTVAKVITPAPTDKSGGEAVFTIGSTTYTVDGETKTLDVAPFIEAGRTYLPIRFAAEAAGADFINWDQATQTATILKGDRVASMKLNTNSITVNGGTITMDVPVKLVNDRVVLPLRFVGQALGNTVDWNEADQTVTVK